MPYVVDVNEVAPSSAARAALASLAVARAATIAGDRAQARAAFGRALAQGVPPGDAVATWLSLGGGLGDSGPSAPSVQPQVRALLSSAKSAALGGDYTNADALFRQAQAIALGSSGGSAYFSDDLSTAANVIYGTSGSAAYDANVAASGGASAASSQQAADATLAQAQANQPTLWDRIVGDLPQVQPLGVGPTAGQIVTAAGGLTSAAGLTTPQSGQDLRAQQNVKRAACLAIPGATWDAVKGCTLPDVCSKLPWPISWACSNPVLGLGAAAIALVAVNAFFKGLSRR